MFKSIKIKNLRAITELEVNNLGQVNLFVGQNNCGKTTILEGLFFLIGATNPRLLLSVNTFRGLTVLSKELWRTFFHNMAITIPIEVSGEVRESREKQKLLIRPKEKKVTVSEPGTSDFVSVKVGVGDSKPPFTPDGLELEYTSTKNPHEKVMSSIFLKGNEIVIEGAKERDVRGIFINPLTIFDWKDRFSETKRKKQITEVIELLKKIEPDISSLDYLEPGLLFADIGLPEMIPANLMGGGIAKCLSVAIAMLYSRDSIVLIDEIEDGLHYTAQQNMWKAILGWAQKLNVQVFVTTHSNESIKTFNNSIDTTLFESETKLFRIERKDEKFRAVEYTKELLAESLESKWEVR
jgi:ABC-type dipeptide/oligopeptide/nickel transport system ATPase component